MHLRAITSGGESLGNALQQWAHQTFGVSINEFYGQTEMNLTVGTVRPKWSPQPGLMGRPFPCFTLALLDPASQPVDTGQIEEAVKPTDDLRQELQILVKNQLAFYQYPRQITFIDQLPMTTTGKSCETI